MGGTVGLKGTDGLLAEALRRGAVPRARDRAVAAVRLLAEAPFFYLTCSGEMGEMELLEAGIVKYRVVHETSGPETTAEDTCRACRAFLESGVDLILFCGGDGTARDLYDVAGDTVPILGIPAGVKMYSSVFALTPEAAAALLLQGPGKGEKILLRDAEVMDVDEEAYRGGELRSRLHGIARSPYRPGLVQGAKQVFEDQDEERARDGIARFLAEVMEGTPDILYFLGPGSTTAAIAALFGLSKTLLGFDAIRGGMLVAADANEQQMLTLLDEHPRARLVVSVIGAQGSVLGRGTQQVSPAVLRRIGADQVIVVATPHKLAVTPLLFVDTGDAEVDASFGRHISVISGYRIARRVKVSAGAGS
jgi:predicted polyphosphate/ATP-dependent NAD kinase